MCIKTLEEPLKSKMIFRNSIIGEVSVFERSTVANIKLLFGTGELQPESGKTEAEGPFFFVFYFHVSALRNANKVFINLADGWQILMRQQQPDVIIAFRFFLSFSSSSSQYIFFFLHGKKQGTTSGKNVCCVF